MSNVLGPEIRVGNARTAQGLTDPLLLASGCQMSSVPAGAAAAAAGPAGL